jgi:urease accessory protein UreF
MRKRITKSDIALLRKRWALVEMAELSELRGLSHAQKARQLSALLRSATLRKWNRFLSAEDRDVRERWRRIREYYRARG